MQNGRLKKGERAKSTGSRVGCTEMYIDGRIRLLEMFSRSGIPVEFDAIEFTDKAICQWSFPERGILPIGSVNTLKSRPEKLQIIRQLIENIKERSRISSINGDEQRSDTMAGKNRQIKDLKIVNQRHIDDLVALRAAYLDLLREVSHAAQYDKRLQDQVRRFHSRWGIVAVVTDLNAEIVGN
jgi:hypothetical protein